MQSKKAASTNDKSQVTRRDFLKMGVSALSALALLEVGGISLMFMQPRSLEGAFGGTVTAGTINSFMAGSVTEFPDGRFFLIRAHDGGFLAIYRRCTHLGCSVNWLPDQNRFFCPCHASSFDINGDVKNPPAPRALDTFSVQTSKGEVIVDTSQIQKRDQFRLEQLVYEG
ncbi:MAG: Rieske (2Fe-2S) protein [Chloroflexi bacterium]|nr:Rieske (2Fe-2S) protein [Chloroflexota bacterium]